MLSFIFLHKIYFLFDEIEQSCISIVDLWGRLWVFVGYIVPCFGVHLGSVFDFSDIKFGDFFQLFGNFVEKKFGLFQKKSMKIY